MTNPTASGTDILDATTVAALEAAVATVGPVACWGLETTSALVADAALRFIAARLLEPETVQVDCWSVAPEGERWKVAEIEPVAYRLHTAPLERHVIGCWSMDRIDAATADRLLKVLEEPPAKMLVALAAAHLESLPITLRSRCVATFTLAAAPVPDAPAHLAALGLHPGIVENARAMEALALMMPHVDAFRAARTGTPARVAAAVPALAERIVKTAKLPASSTRALRTSLAELLLDDLELRLAETLHAGTLPDRQAGNAITAARAALRTSLAALPSLAVALRHDPALR